MTVNGILLINSPTIPEMKNKGEVTIQFGVADLNPSIYVRWWNNDKPQVRTIGFPSDEFKYGDIPWLEERVQQVIDQMRR